MSSETAVAVKRRMHVIDASANAAEARQMMLELGVTWLGLCREGVLVGAILSVRSATGAPVDAANTRGRASRHAALSYFLYLKSLMHSGTDRERMVAVLERDARGEAREAALEDPDFDVLTVHGVCR